MSVSNTLHPMHLEPYQLPGRLTEGSWVAAPAQYYSRFECSGNLG